jgi:hypothetical protein
VHCPEAGAGLDPEAERFDVPDRLVDLAITGVAAGRNQADEVALAQACRFGQLFDRCGMRAPARRGEHRRWQQ